MDVKPLLCLAAALVAVCHGCSTGKEFITTFLPNYYSHGKSHSLHLVLTAQSSAAEVHIQVASVRFSKHLTLAAGETRWVSLPCGAELKKQCITTNSAVRISSSAEISVFSYNRRFKTGDGTVVSPVEKLGTEYVVYTPLYNKRDKLVAIVNGNRQNSITITPANNMCFKCKSESRPKKTRWRRWFLLGHLFKRNRLHNKRVSQRRKPFWHQKQWKPKKQIWKRGKATTITLEPYASFLVRSRSNLQGMRIKSKTPVAVLAGHQCLSLCSTCEHVYEQLPPVAHLGKDYLVPGIGSSRTTSWAIVVAAEDNTEVVAHRGHRQQKQTLRTAGSVKAYTVNNKHPLLIKSNKRVMAMLVSNNKPNDPFMLTLTPTCKMATRWTMETLAKLDSTVAIVSEREGASSVRVCLNGHCQVPHWIKFPSNNKWVWSHVAVGRNQAHVTVEGDSRMVVYAYGGTRYHGYGVAGVCSKVTSPPPPAPDSCEKVTCRKKERCEDGKCIHTSTAKCHAVGDPHYSTFDGLSYDFQGSCTYIMATVVRKAPDLTPFTITTKNDHRGSSRVSYVRRVTVSVHQQTIVIGRYRGRVEVNGELQYLPVRLLDAKVSVENIGGYAVLRTDFGLTVKYDWNMRLTITVPSSYYEHLGGLCGNYNGKRDDDLPSGRSVTSVLKMILKWKVKNTDRTCREKCHGRCPSCSPSKRAHYQQPNRCGVLTQANGPFSPCHKHINPNNYLENCVFDVCINTGAKQILCDNLKSYNDACLSEGVKVDPEWRKIVRCPFACPAGSHYEACGSACPANCMNPNGEKQCKRPCVAGCQCDGGLVLSGDRCVPKSQCGCQYQGKYHPSGTTFWGDNKCATKCKCVNGKTKCKSVTCKKNEHCTLRNGVRDCYPASYATCQGTGDPHYKSFDGRRFDFQGTCVYVLSQLVKGSQQDLEHFQVLVQNENRGRNKAVSFTKSVSITVFGTIVSMSRASPGKILVNSRSVNLPFSLDDGKLTMFRQGYFGVVKTNFGLTLKFNWNSQVYLTLPSSYSAATSGLCGNYNEKPGDDLLKADGTQAGNDNDFGHSWKVGGDAGCTSDCPGGKCPNCEPALLQRYQQGRYCGIISDKNGPFKSCHAKLNQADFRKDCVFDMCMYQGHASALCNSLSAFSTSCQEAGATVESWRTEQLCPPQCSANSHYEVCAAPCQQTCSGLTIPEGCDESAPCSEGCVCDDGFVLSHDKCVPVAECGCQYQGEYYQSGQVFYLGQSCSTQCVCTDSGQVECDATSHCTDNEKCVLKDGVPACSPKSIDSCSVYGVRTVWSFDKKASPLWGDCWFTLAEVKEEKGGRPPFTVLIQQETAKDGSVSRNVELQLYDLEITMETGHIWEIKVDNIAVSLPVSLADGKVQVHQNGVHIIIVTDFDLTLTYDTTAGVLLQIPSTYRSSTQGLCGNYNGDPSDDPAADNSREVAGLVVTRDEVVCEVGCGGNPCPGPDKQTGPDAEKECEIIKAQDGPMAGCHSSVSPTAYFDACVREMKKKKKGDQDVLCRHIQIYVAACQLSGAKIKKWRSDSFCPLKCPAGSHYELCSSSCTSTCFSLEQTPEPCPACQEGCQCDDGLMSDGVHCVPVEKCGCVVDGQYYKSDVPVFREDCAERCVCEAGQFKCTAAKCQEGEECSNKDGVLGCHSTDPCDAVKCRIKEHCEVSDGEAECVPDYEATCWVAGDPHYNTFDGLDYSFQGTCTYVLVNTTGLDPSLPSVTVTTKNELRGNSDGSFLRSATVELAGHSIFIPRGNRGTVLLDGVKSTLPVFLEEDGISITQAGIKGILQSDIGVEVTFDWTTLLMVSISSSFFGNVGGLCGNYNGDKLDEMTVTGGGATGNVTDWAGSWSVPDGDPFCYHYCEGECPQCSDENRKKFTSPEFCGFLSDKRGPFSGCHDSLPPEQFVTDCLYDVCVNEGRHAVLCEALSAYGAECQEMEATVLPWRQLAQCSLECPANSHYETCGSACPPTCGPQPQVCPKICVEGCFCDKGFVQSGQECVIREKGCGCDYEGKYYLPGQVFWPDSQCLSKCVCDAATQTAKCEEKEGCPAGQQCSIVDGVQGCFPTSFKDCSARGDPHFHTFDGLKFDFQGNCIYRLASLCGEAKDLEHFEIRLQNNNRGNKRVSYAKVVTVKVFDNTYVLSFEQPYKVLVNGMENSLPFSSGESLVRVHRRNRLAVLETNFLKVSFDFASTVRVELATSYQGATCGLCGNFNNNPADDLTKPDGKPASSATEFGVSQWLADSAGCSVLCKDCAQPLPTDFTPPGYTSVCDVITAQDGPLADCIERVDAKQFHSDCIYDVVQSGGKQDAACDIISAYVEECQRQKGCVKSWRTRQRCWMQCPARSLYNVAASGCPVSCTSPQPPADCKNPPSEACVCNPGFLLSQDRCVPLAECGCQFQGQYITSGQEFYADADCERVCKCQGGMVACEKKPCQGKCEVWRGVRRCYEK